LGQQTHIELNKLNDNSEDIVNVLKKHTSLILFQIKKYWQEWWFMLKRDNVTTCKCVLSFSAIGFVNNGHGYAWKNWAY
jgi:hypothetical protein